MPQRIEDVDLKCDQLQAQLEVKEKWLEQLEKRLSTLETHYASETQQLKDEIEKEKVKTQLIEMRMSNWKTGFTVITASAAAFGWLIANGERLGHIIKAALGVASK